MKGTLTDEERDAMTSKANAEDEAKRQHHWWVTTTQPQRKQMLRRAIQRALYGQAVA